MLTLKQNLKTAIYPYNGRRFLIEFFDYDCFPWVRVYELVKITKYKGLFNRIPYESEKQVLINDGWTMDDRAELAKSMIIKHLEKEKEDIKNENNLQQFLQTYGVD